MRTFPALPALAVVCTALLAGCGTDADSTANGASGTENTEASPSAPADPNDDFQSLQVNMVAESGTYFPDGVEGIEFGCSDTLVTIDTVPIETETREDHVAAAVEFLLNDSQYYHGSPSVTNALTISETLELSSVDVGRSSVDVELTGDIVVRSDCEAYRVQAQLYGTAAAAAGVEDVSVVVEGTELNDVLGLEPFDTEQLADDGE